MNGALDFPPNPNVGDVFLNWMWDGTKWTRIGGIPTQTVVFMSPTPPPYPELGNLWWDSIGGNLYVWFIDSTSSQWVIANLGMQGLQGPMGPPGPQGLTGAAVNILPPVLTQSDLPLTGNNAGDGRVTLDTGDLWVWDGTGWFTTGPIQGPPGNQGPPGPTGPAGPPFQPATTGTGNIFALSIGPQLSAPTILSPSITGGATIAGGLNTGPQTVAGSIAQVGAGNNFTTVGTAQALGFLNTSGANIVSGRAIGSNQTNNNMSAISNQTPVMFGAGCIVTPTVSGNILVMVQGRFGQQNAANFDLAYGLYYGTGAAPAQGVAGVGTAFGLGNYAAIQGTNNANADTIFIVGVAAGLTLGTAYWFDLQVFTALNMLGYIGNVLLVAVEI